MGKYYCDYHVHSKYSFDSNETLEEIIKSASEKSLNEICITEHHSFDSNDPSYKYLDIEGLKLEVMRILKSKNYDINVKFGIELGEGHLFREEFIKWREPRSIDFVIGSIHNIGDLTIRKTINKYGVIETYEKYFEEVLLLAKKGDFDVLGHLDLIQRYAYEHSGIYEIENYREYIEEILKTLIKRGKGIEVNTSGINKNISSYHPRIEILHIYKELKGEIITVGSDAHNAQRVGEYVKETYKLLADIGFEYIYTYKNRESMAVKI